MDKLETLDRLEALKDRSDRKEFATDAAFISWATKVVSLLSFDSAFEVHFSLYLTQFNMSSSTQTLQSLIKKMRKLLDEAIEALKDEIKIDNGPEAIKLTNSQKAYIHLARIRELKQVTSDKFDLCKLHKLCEELNICYRAQNLIAIITLTRALIDHIPPIFGFKTFAEVVNNYGGSKSFKESMDRLDSSCRKIADQNLHTPIRRKESLPTMNQVDFSNDIDVLLAEIYRILKHS